MARKAVSQTMLVSFLMPVYNAGSTIARAVDSVLGQRGLAATEIELVAVDDGSTDNTPEVLERLARRESRLRLVRLPHQGQVGAAIEGQRHLEGNFIARMDADDIACPDRLAEQLKLMHSDPGLGLVGASVRYFPRKYVKAGALHYEAWLNSFCQYRGGGTRTANDKIRREIFVECPLAGPTFLVRRQAFLQAGGYRDNHNWPEDYDLVFRVAGAGWRLGGATGEGKKALHLWREHPARASRNDPRYSEKSFRSIKLHYLLRDRLDNGRKPVSICGAGPVGKAWLKELQAAGVEVRFLIEVNPRKIGKTIHGVPVVRAEQLSRLDCGPGLILGAVGQKGARESIRANLGPLGLVEGEDYIFIA
ncbi:MAG: glycosyltransferase [Gemmatimonadota bacterium]|nr:glycosyltransferase [Gemmatimonadota bacterium]